MILQHEFYLSLHAGKDAGHVDGHEPVPLFEWGLMKPIGLVYNPGIVYCDIDPIEGGYRLICHSGNICGVGYIRHNLEHFSACFL